MILTRIIFLLGTALMLVLPLPWSGPEETLVRGQNVVQLGEDFPEPTTPPRALVKKSVVSTFPPEVCGWLWGTDLYTMCRAFSTCFWRTDISVVGCCRDTTNLNTCSMYTGCVDLTDIAPCTTACTSNSLFLQCSNSVNPYCGSLRFGSSYYNYVCGASHYFWDVSLSATNATASLTGIPRFVAPASITSSLSSLNLPTAPVTSLPVSTITTISSAQLAQSRKPIGAIVGGTIAGLAVVCGAACLTFLMVLRNKRLRSNTPPAIPFGPRHNTAPNEMDGSGRHTAELMDSKEPKQRLGLY